MLNTHTQTGTLKILLFSVILVLHITLAEYRMLIIPGLVLGRLRILI